MAATIAPPTSWPAMVSYGGPAMCCARDGGAGVLMSLQSAVSLWEQPFGRGGMQGVRGSSFGGGLQSRFPGQCVELSGGIRRNQGWQVNVAADHSGSKPEAHKRRGKWGYHPLEGLTKHEREAMQAGNGRPSDADVARTITEVNWSAIIMSSDVTDEDSVLGTEVHYLVDERGDFIFEMNDDSEFLSNLSSSQTFTVLIGFGPMDEIQITDMIEEVGEDEDEDSDLLEDDSDDSEEEDLEDFDEQFWQEMVAGAPPDLLQEGLSPESLGSLGGWGGPDTLQWVHPMEFANKIVQAISVDHSQDMNKPTKRLTIKGIVRKVTEEEEPYVQSLWYDRFLWDEDDESDLEEEHVGGDRGSKLGDKDSIARSRVNGAASTSRTTAQGPGMGKSNSKTGTKRTGNKSDSKVNVSRQKNGSLSSSSRGVAVTDSSLTTSSVVNIQDPRRGETDASNVGTSASGSSLSNDQKLQVGSRIEDLEICGKGDGEESSEEGGDALEGEWTDEETSEDVGTTFYKLEMISIELDSSSGLQTSIEVQEFCDGEPDILAHCSAAIIDRMNFAGNKTEEALKALCRREKGLEVEEVAVSGVDCLGVELRVSAGIEIQTLRFQFNRKATCEKVADQMIDQLLYPRPGQKRPRKGQQRPSRR